MSIVDMEPSSSPGLLEKILGLSGTLSLYGSIVDRAGEALGQERFRGSAPEPLTIEWAIPVVVDRAG